MPRLRHILFGFTANRVDRFWHYAAYRNRLSYILSANRPV